MTPTQQPSPAAASEWRPIESAPRDGTEIILTWMDQGEPQDIARMRWNPSATNFLFSGVVGMWDADSFTWTENDPDGAPTHWKPITPSPPPDANVAGSDSGESPTTNSACPTGVSKLDDHGRGGFLSAGSLATDRSGRTRGPIKVSTSYLLVDDAHGYATFELDGSRLGGRREHPEDLIAPWIDWKAELLACLGHLSERDWFKDPDFHNKHVVCSLDADKVRTAVNAALTSLKGEGAGE